MDRLGHGSRRDGEGSDADIIHAFEELPDASGWDHPRSWMVGGNIQLARAFSTFAKSNPDRAFRILASLDKDNGTRAAAYALDSLSEDAKARLVIGILRDVVGRGFDSSVFAIPPRVLWNVSRGAARRSTLRCLRCSNPAGIKPGRRGSRR